MYDFGDRRAVLRARQNALVPIKRTVHVVTVEDQPKCEVSRWLRKIAPALKLQPVAPSALARDPAVGEAYRNDPLTDHGGVTLISATEIVDAGEAAIADASDHVVPTLLLQGDTDKLAFPIGATRFVK